MAIYYNICYGQFRNFIKFSETTTQCPINLDNMKMIISKPQHILLKCPGIVSKCPGKVDILGC